jgi:hypothetical protein
MKVLLTEGSDQTILGLFEVSEQSMGRISEIEQEIDRLRGTQLTIERTLEGQKELMRIDREVLGLEWEIRCLVAESPRVEFEERNVEWRRR